MIEHMKLLPVLEYPFAHGFAGHCSLSAVRPGSQTVWLTESKGIQHEAAA